MPPRRARNGARQKAVADESATDLAKLVWLLLLAAAHGAALCGAPMLCERLAALEDCWNTCRPSSIVTVSAGHRSVQQSRRPLTEKTQRALCRRRGVITDVHREENRLLQYHSWSLPSLCISFSTDNTITKLPRPTLPVEMFARQFPDMVPQVFSCGLCPGPPGLQLTSKHLVFPQPAEAEVRPQPWSCGVLHFRVVVTKNVEISGGAFPPRRRGRPPPEGGAT